MYLYSLSLYYLTVTKGWQHPTRKIDCFVKISKYSRVIIRSRREYCS